MTQHLAPGPRNAITDVAGLRVGHAADQGLRSGVSVVVGARPFVAAVHVMGGAPGTAETDLLAPDKLVREVDALVLSGGSAFGLAAADGVRAGLRRAGRGFAVGGQRVPIVPVAILFDLLNGGDKAALTTVYPVLGACALDAAGEAVPEGSAGAGFGATCGRYRGGIGTASLSVGPITVGALVAVNALGEAVADADGRFWAAPFETGAEFGGLGVATVPTPPALPQVPRGPGEATTIAIVATDATLDQAQATRLAVAAHDGLARALVPSHTLLDGDAVFAAATGVQPLPDPLETPLALGHAAALCLSRAVARGIWHAASAPEGMPPSWRDRHG